MGDSSVSLKELRRDFFPGAITGDLLGLSCGDLLGSGCYRIVFVYAPDPTKVIKFETQANSFQNILEWEAWQKLEDGPLGKWLAPSRTISANGAMLIQDRTTPTPPGYKWPAKVPHFMTDLKRANFGLIGRRLVCHDYSLSLFGRSSFSVKPRAAKWWD